MDATCYPALSGNVAYYNWRNAVRDAGTISFNQTWYANLDYVVEGALTINAGATLTVQPGTTVKFNDTGQRHRGERRAGGGWHGRAEDRFHLRPRPGAGARCAQPADGGWRIANRRMANRRSANAQIAGWQTKHRPHQASSTIGYRMPCAGPWRRRLLLRRPRHAGGCSRRSPAAALAPDDAYWPVAGDWGRISFSDSSDDTKNVLNYAVVRYAGYSVNNAIYITSAAPRITNSQITHNTGHGLYLESQANPTVEGNSFIRNSLSGIYVRTASAPIIRNNTFRNQGAYAVEMEADAKPRFSGNVATDNATNGVKVTGTVAGATTWDANLVYVAGAVTIPSGASLTLVPGRSSSSWRARTGRSTARW